jgi:hypothetical protein
VERRRPTARGGDGRRKIGHARSWRRNRPPTWLGQRLRSEPRGQAAGKRLLSNLLGVGRDPARHGIPTGGNGMAESSPPQQSGRGSKSADGWSILGRRRPAWTRTGTGTVREKSRAGRAIGKASRSGWDRMSAEIAPGSLARDCRTAGQPAGERPQLDRGGACVRAVCVMMRVAFFHTPSASSLAARASPPAARRHPSIPPSIHPPAEGWLGRSWRARSTIDYYVRTIGDARAYPEGAVAMPSHSSRWNIPCEETWKGIADETRPTRN